MGLIIREPLDVDFTVINRSPTKEEISRIRERMKEDKAIRASHPEIFSFESYPNSQPTEKDFIKMGKEMERL